MLYFKTGNLFDEDAEALVNSVNCVGVMGRGVALQFKNAYPANFQAYKEACDRDLVQPGQMFVFELSTLGNPRYIINFPTKRHWKSKSRIRDIDDGLDALVRVVRQRGIRSLALPPLASGLGGLNWSDVRPRIESALSQLHDVRIVVFEPTSESADGRPNRSIVAPAMSTGNAVLVGLIHRYLEGLLEPWISLLEIHKLMYFMQESGEELSLNYTKQTYGPYATNLRHVMRRLEGHYLRGYNDGGDTPSKLIQLVPGAVQDAEEFLASEPVTQARFARVAKLVDGYETPHGLELLSTVHWVVTKENHKLQQAIIDSVYGWSPHKRQFTERQIRLALENLEQDSWLSLTVDSDDLITEEDFPRVPDEDAEQGQLFDS